MLHLEFRKKKFADTMGKKCIKPKCECCLPLNWWNMLYHTCETDHLCFVHNETINDCCVALMLCLSIMIDVSGCLCSFGVKVCYNFRSEARVLNLEEANYAVGQEQPVPKARSNQVANLNWVSTGVSGVII